MAISVVRSMLLALTVCAVAMSPAPFAHAQQTKPAKQAKQATKAGKQKQQQAAEPKQAAIVVDANTGQVLHAQSADEPRFPASLTKMMTIYMLFGEIERGRLTFQSRIRFSERAVAVAPSKLGLEVGEEITALDAVKALVVKSANDVAVAVAEHIGGTEHQFARMMTERARQIGMTSTTFRNASGLPNPGQRSTARDMATLALRLQDDYPQHYHLFSTATFTYAGKTYRTHNTLMLGFPGMDGIKTGYTRASGFNLVSSVRAGGKHVVGAVFGGKTAATRNAHMRSLLFAALEKASPRRTRQGGPMLVAQARPAKPAQARADLAWAAETKAASREKTVKAPPKAVAKAPPAPVPAPAVRPARAPEAHDPIAAVLAEGDESSSADAAGQAAASTLPPPRLDLDALRAAMSETEPQGDRPQDIAGLIRNSIVDGTASAPPARPLSETAGAAAPVRQPSTLGAQASALAMAAPSRLKGPAPFRAAPVGAGYEIQIGAYTSAQEAQARLDQVRARAVGLLEGHSGVTIPVNRDNRQIFRARFVNFDENAASNACLELRRLAIDCFVMKAD